MSQGHEVFVIKIQQQQKTAQSNWLNEFPRFIRISNGLGPLYAYVAYSREEEKKRENQLSEQMFQTYLVLVDRRVIRENATIHRVF